MLQTQKNRCSLQWDLTFFKQKLALLTAHHDPYHCSMCGISAPDKMKFCSKCDLARYCSRKCQTEDWKKSHKVSCHEIVSLRHSIFCLSERYDEVNQIYSEKTGNEPGHNTGLTSLHQITTCVIKLRFSRYPCLINCVTRLRFSRYPGLKGIITVIDPCIQMLWHSRLYWRIARLLDRIGSTDFNISRCHSDSVVHNLNWLVLM